MVHLSFLYALADATKSFLTTKKKKEREELALAVITIALYGNKLFRLIGSIIIEGWFRTLSPKGALCATCGALVELLAAFNTLLFFIV